MGNIELCNISQLKEIFEIYKDCRFSMQQENIFQWYDDYPSVQSIREDIEKQNLFGYYEAGKCLGAVAINTIQDEEYKEINWEDKNGNVVVIHRLAVNPELQNKGIGKLLMDFAEDYARKKNYSSIRLDSYSANKKALRFYEKRGYKKRGECFFIGRDLPFYCYELIF